MTNATIALMIAAVALGLKGRVLTPAFTFIATAQSLTWAGLEPVFCDVDADTHQVSPESAGELMDDRTCAILGVHLWSNPCAVGALQGLADRHGSKLYLDAAHAFGSRIGGHRVGGFGDLEVFSFHATKMINGMEGGCVTTNDDVLAARLRNIRSSYGAGPPVDIPFTGNGRLSEAQAAMTLLSLDEFPELLRRNRAYRRQYRERLSSLPGIRFPAVLDGTEGNDQYVVFEVDQAEFGLSRDRLAETLRAENVLCRRYFTPGVHRSVPYRDRYPQYVEALPVTDRLCRTVMQLPSGRPVSTAAIERICELVADAHRHAGELNRHFGQAVA